VSPQRRTRTSFAPKDGANFNRRLNVRFHGDDVADLEAAKQPGDSLADVVRAAVREYLHRRRKP